MKTGKRICLGLACITIALGIILVIFSVSFGGNKVFKHKDYTYKLEDVAEEVSSLDFDLSYGAIKIVSGDSFHVFMNNIPEDGYTSYVKNGTWIIEDSENSNDIINFFGIKIPFDSFGINVNIDEDNTPNMIITIPEDFHGENINIDLGAGMLTADKISGDKVTLTVGAGKMEVKELNVSSYVDMECGAGELVISEMTAQDVKVDCGVGNLRIKGSILGNAKINCGLGNVSLDLNGDEDSYNYTIDCGIGNVIINDRSYRGTTHTTINNKNTIGNFDLECGIGQIKLYVR